MLKFRLLFHLYLLGKHNKINPFNRSCFVMHEILRMIKFHEPIEDHHVPIVYINQSRYIDSIFLKTVNKYA